MNRPMLAQADLFGDDDEDCGPTLRAAWANAMPARRRCAALLLAPEQAAQVLDAHDNYRVLRRLKPRPADPTYRFQAGESIALLVDVETTGLDHRQLIPFFDRHLRRTPAWSGAPHRSAPQTQGRYEKRSNACGR